MAPRRKIRNDLIGKKIGMLTLNKIIGQTESRDYLWDCTCDCGNHVVRGQQNLLKDYMSSCGCYTRAFLTPGDSERCSKAGIARAKKRNVDGCNFDMTFREGTIKTNTSGVQGVSWANNIGRWHVYIGYKSYRANLGYYDDFEIAKMVRELAEEHIKKGDFEDFFYEVRGYRLGERQQQQYKIKEGKYWKEAHVDRKRG